MDILFIMFYCWQCLSKPVHLNMSAQFLPLTPTSLQNSTPKKIMPELFQVNELDSCSRHFDS